MRVDELQPPEGSRRPRRRVGRGIAGKGGKTAGRGTKGQKARDTVPAGFEGGQLPLTQRIPKLRGFTNPFRVEYQAVNLDTLDELGLDEVSPEVLHRQGVTHKGAFVKLLGRGQINRAVRVRVHAASRAAEAAVVAAGGTVEIVPLPFGDRRPPAKGNALTNR